VSANRVVACSYTANPDPLASRHLSHTCGSWHWHPFFVHPSRISAAVTLNEWGSEVWHLTNEEVKWSDTDMLCNSGFVEKLGAACAGPWFPAPSIFCIWKFRTTPIMISHRYSVCDVENQRKKNDQAGLYMHNSSILNCYCIHFCFFKYNICYVLKIILPPFFFYLMLDSTNLS
jgi:hypothetical protein